MKQYIANTPLILQDENGVDVRIERGAVVSLSDTQYEEVAAHVTAIATDEPSEAETPSSEAPPETLPESNQAEQVETPDSATETEATVNTEAENSTTAKRGKAKSAE